MQRLLLISAFWVGFVFRGHAQSISVWIEQLGALQALQQTIGQGYRIQNGDLETIGSIGATEYGLHRQYFGSMDTVKTALNQDPRVIALQALEMNLWQQINTTLDYWRKQRDNQR